MFKVWHNFYEIGQGKPMFCQFCRQEAPPPFKQERFHVNMTCKQCLDKLSRAGI